MAKKTDAMSEEERNAYHAEKMKKKKEARDKILATKTEEKGLLIVHTGKGKGKSTAAFGMVFRALGHGFKIGIVQFVKGKWGTGERDILEKFPDQVTIRAMGEGFTWETADRARDIAAAKGAWEMAKEMGRLDIGQTVIVNDTAVIAVEAIEGTDQAILRAGQLCKRGGFTVVKVSKPQQDCRFDVPTIGVQTLRSMHEAGGRVLAIEAGQTIIIDEEEVIGLADKLGIAIVSLNAEEAQLRVAC